MTEPSQPAAGDEPTARAAPAPAQAGSSQARGARAEGDDLNATGFFKALPTSGRLAGLWMRLGLLLGRQLALVIRDDHVLLILMAAVVGVTSGAAAGALLAWIAYAITLFPQPEEGDPWLRWLVVLGVPVVGGLLAGVLHLLVRRVLRQKLVMGVPAVIEAVALRGGTIRGRQAVLTGLGTGITIGSGGSCGHEGPSVAIGAAVGSVLARFFGMRARWHLSMVGAGLRRRARSRLQRPARRRHLRRRGRVRRRHRRQRGHHVGVRPSGRRRRRRHLHLARDPRRDDRLRGRRPTATPCSSTSASTSSSPCWPASSAPSWAAASSGPGAWFERPSSRPHNH
jgi:hypothetical protein